MTNEDLKGAAAKSMAEGGDIRSKVRDLTLAAIQQRKFDFQGMRAVMDDVAAGISLGAQQRSEDMKQALTDAFAGVDEALTKSAHASQLALHELYARTKEINDTELKAAMDSLKGIERDFLATMSQAAERTGGRVKTEMQDLIAHATRTGTDTGAMVAQAVTDLSQRMTASAMESTAAGMAAARTLGERFALVASGFLAGMSEALAAKATEDKSKDK
jgi:hypothetical protein